MDTEEEKFILSYSQSFHSQRYSRTGKETGTDLLPWLGKAVFKTV